MELREVVWLGSGDLPAPLQAPLVQALRERPAEALRKAALYAGLQPDKEIKLQPLDAALSQHAAACLYPSLASSGSAESRDALVALAALLAPYLGLAVLAASKPSYQAGSTFSLRSRAPRVPLKPAAPVPPPPTSWSAAATDNADDIMDEDDLLDEDDLKKKVATKSDCAPDKQGRRKACANCSCGLREIQENGGDAPPAPKSACGSCGLGDAYRCADCPHLGKPSFKSGEEANDTVKLSDGMFGDGVASATATKVATGGGGVVKLELDDIMDF